MARAPVAIARAPVASMGAHTRSCRNMAGVAMARAPVVAAKVPATLLRAPTRPFRNSRRVQASSEVHHPSPEQPADTVEYLSAAPATPSSEATWVAAVGVGLELLRDANDDDILYLAVAGPSPVPPLATQQGLNASSSAVPQPPPEGQAAQMAFEAAATASSAALTEAVPTERRSSSCRQQVKIRRGRGQIPKRDHGRTERGTAQPASDDEGADVP